MMATTITNVCELETPKRNRYFFGKLLDVGDFERSQAYFNKKRWMLNRLVSGFGVVCGLNVRFGPDGRSVVIEPGLAIDKHGREIVVPEETAPIPIPEHLLVPGPAPCGEGEAGAEDKPRPPEPSAGDRYKPGEKGNGEEGDILLHVLLCYHECMSAPQPVYAGICKEETYCQPGCIEERYKVLFRPGCLPPPAPQLRITGVIKGGAKPELDYGVLAKWVSRKCPECPRDPCIPLANLCVRANNGQTHCMPDVDITIRPICFSNDLLFQLVLGLISEQPDYRTEK